MTEFVNRRWGTSKEYFGEWVTSTDPCGITEINGITLLGDPDKAFSKLWERGPLTSNWPGAPRAGLLSITSSRRVEWDGNLIKDILADQLCTYSLLFTVTANVDPAFSCLPCCAHCYYWSAATAVRRDCRWLPTMSS